MGAGHDVHVTAEGAFGGGVRPRMLELNDAAAVGRPAARDRALERAGDVGHLALEDVDQERAERARERVRVTGRVAVVELGPDQLGHRRLDQVPVHFAACGELDSAAVGHGAERHGAAVGFFREHVPDFALLRAGVFGEALALVGVFLMVCHPERACQIAAGHAPVEATQIPVAGHLLAAGVGLGRLIAAAAPAGVEVTVVAGRPARSRAAIRRAAGGAGYQLVPAIVATGAEGSE